MYRQTNPVFTVAIVAVGARYMGPKSPYMARVVCA